ncbi:unnamed protein product [Commensalibacter communis]|uniref:Uncharacterized protein n=1 Tax=Commensalibacter communis TaxID=2972786 RepID=A0A9W4TRV0_9PROT|nr:hypothetical protein [Commensalibacter communis]CAI3954264.1 unnamed protein product [Commensalibacter communis]CAI3958145.1 unnamed protein product [Commensalibacter communis]CAI3958593.1 unnamed protein product [Commensalibacter communis]CAI3960024.1 unnamed protein product [Commensalibacter communis]
MFYDLYKLAFETSPILLTGGVAELAGGVLPIIAISEGLNLGINALLGNFEGVMESTRFFSFKPSAGGSVIQNTVGMYPFLNQATAANTIITEPLHFSLTAYCPVDSNKKPFDRLVKFETIVNALTYHNNNGGLYTVLTPSYIYRDCFLTNVVDLQSGVDDSGQSQVTWRFDFIKPLISEEKTKQVLTSFLNKTKGGNVTQASWGSFGNSLKFWE